MSLIILIIIVCSLLFFSGVGVFIHKLNQTELKMINKKLKETSPESVNSNSALLEPINLKWHVYSHVKLTSSVGVVFNDDNSNYPLFGGPQPAPRYERLASYKLDSGFIIKGSDKKSIDDWYVETHLN